MNDLGHLSADELAIEGRTAMKLRLADERYEAEKMTEWHEAKLRSAIASNDVPSWEMAEQYGYWRARLALILDRQQREGFAEC